MRPLLKRPLGELFAEADEAIERLRKLRPTRLIAVGDITTAELLAAGIKPDIVIVDFKVMRSPASDDIRRAIDSHPARVLWVRNPAGTITPELRDALETASPPAKIIVDGEEDLAVLPAALAAPVGSVVAYGQPNEGLVLVIVTEQKKREFRGLLKLFKKG